MNAFSISASCSTLFCAKKASSSCYVEMAPELAMALLSADKVGGLQCAIQLSYSNTYQQEQRLLYLVGASSTQDTSTIQSSPRREP
jgi:hypothetical protein